LIDEERTAPGQRGRQSRFRATSRLIEAFADAVAFDYQLQGFIRLKNEAGDLIPYIDTDVTRRMYRALAEVNEFLGALDLYLDAPDITRTRHHLVVDGAHYRPTTPGLYRVFNRGSFNMGGRAYAWWQGLPKTHRRQILLNGEPVAEPDFVQMHPAILYAGRGHRLEGDAYETGEFPREHGKLAFNIALNTKTQQGTISALTKKPSWPYSGQDTARLLDVLKRRNAPIAGDLHADKGIRLMRIDSEITLDAMKACAKAGIPALPVHDSMLTPTRYEDRVAEIMEASAARRLKASAPCKVRVSGYSVPHMPSLSPLPSPSSSPCPSARLGPICFESGVPSLPAPVQLELFEGVTLADPPAFGRQLREARARLGVSQNDFGKLIGCRQPHVANVERGRDRLSEWSRRRLREMVRVAA
jgi:hypothetical protein